jgi:uncharacterized protein with HEPN domain
MPIDIDKFDRVRLMHMLAAAREALEFSAGRTRASLDTDPMFRRGLVNCLQEIGEAAVKVSRATRDQTPAVPWKQIAGMRNRLVHVYFAINHDLVWEVVEKDLSPLVRALSELLPKDGSQT